MGNGGTQDTTGRGNPFDAVDASLTIFALANGMDLVREPAARRLEWYRDGLDRGILLEAGPDGRLQATALAWNREEPGTPARSTPLDPMPADLPTRALTATLEEGLRAANAL
jgi:hypothetical protein